MEIEFGRGQMNEREVKELLQQCRDLKVQRSGNIAFRAAEKAYEASKRLSPPNSSLECEAAYRLAHMLLRKEGLDSGELWRIDELLCEASRTGLLGVLPQIYRLPALHRLAQAGSSDAVQLLESVWRDVLRTNNLTNCHDYSLQNPTFNLVELASYFLGKSSDDVIGLGALEEPTLRDSWLVIGNGIAASAEYEWREALARNEFLEKASQLDDVLLIEVSEVHNRWAWKKKDMEVKWKRLTSGRRRRAKLLIHLIRNPLLAHEAIQDLMFLKPRANQRNLLDQDRGRVETDVAKLSDLGGRYSLFPIPGRFELSESASILALCQVRELETRE